MLSSYSSPKSVNRLLEDTLTCSQSKTCKLSQIDLLYYIIYYTYIIQKDRIISKALRKEGTEAQPRHI